MSSAAIRTEGLTRDFGRLRALDGLELEIPRGAIFAFLRPNGAAISLAIVAATAGLLLATRARFQRERLVIG